MSGIDKSGVVSKMRRRELLLSYKVRGVKITNDWRDDLEMEYYE